MTTLHTDVLGDGDAALFVHGSFGSSLDTFPEQRALADAFRVVLVDRRGFGGSSSTESDGWPTDMQDVAALLDEVGPAHLVGQSYGAVVALLAAGIRPDGIRSLVAIEPPVFELARGDPDADASTARLKPVYERAGELDARAFAAEWGRGGGMTEERLSSWMEGFGDKGWAAAEATRRERWPGDAPIRLDVLAATAVPKVLVRGAWRPEVVGRDGAGRDFAATCDVIADQIGAKVVVFERSTHNPQLEEPEAFNRMLRDLWAEVT